MNECVLLLQVVQLQFLMSHHVDTEQYLRGLMSSDFSHSSIERGLVPLLTLHGSQVSQSLDNNCSNLLPPLFTFENVAEIVKNSTGSRIFESFLTFIEDKSTNIFLTLRNLFNRVPSERLWERRFLLD